MLRTTMDKAHIKRTIRPLYGWTQTTPADMKLDPEWDRSVDIYPGMVAMRTTGELVSLIDGTGQPFGFFGLYIGGDGIDEVADQGVNSVAVWVLAPDAQFEVLAPAFDTEASWDDDADGADVLIHAATTGDSRGKLVPAGHGDAGDDPVARLIKVNSETKLTIGGLAVRAAPNG